MRCAEFTRKVCNESSIHGVSYITKRELHWTERVIWCGILISAIYFSVSICLNQWQRFRDNPIVYALELAWDKPYLPYTGITMCSRYYNEDDNVALIEKTWNVSRSDTEQFNYYWDFLMVVVGLRYDNLETLTPYVDDEALQNLNFIDILMEVRKKILEPKPTNDNATVNAAKGFAKKFNRQLYAEAITEAGLCKTTSQLTKYTNPYGELKDLPVSEVKYCRFMAECNSKLFPREQDDTSLEIYLHNPDEVASPNDRSTIYREIGPDSSVDIELELSVTTAEVEVRNLPIAYRKCRYPEENNLKYFEQYRPSLCRIECRINAALKLCKCKPFFYAVPVHEPHCDLKGLHCLATKAWWNTTCNCVPLCEEISYTSLQTTEQTDDVFQFERTVIVKLTRPYMALKRRVVFSTDQLIMSFGGAIGLFMGASFASIYEIFIQFYELFYTIVEKRYTNRRRHKASVRMVAARPMNSMDNQWVFAEK